jgi:hypothetical protein
MPANILNLPCYKVLGITENEHDYHIDVEVGKPPALAVGISYWLRSFGRGEAAPVKIVRPIQFAAPRMEAREYF